MGLLSLWLAVAARADAAGKRSILILPVRSHWVSASLADAVSQALPTALTQAGFVVTEMVPGSPAFRLGTSEGWLGPDDLAGDKVDTLRHRLAVEIGTDASLTSEVVEHETEALLRAELAGAVSRRTAAIEVRVPTVSGGEKANDRRQVAEALAKDLASRVTPEVWTLVGADGAGRRAAAPDRAAAGQAAMADRRYQDAMFEYDAALAAQPDNPDYIRGAAEADVARGDPTEALPLLQRLAGLRPDDREVLLRLGDAALLAKDASQAEAAFMRAGDAEPADPRAVEGMARAARAKGQRDRAQQYYQRLIASLPALSESPSWLSALLADQTDDSILLTGPGSDANLALGRLYLRSGHAAEGVRLLLAYQGTSRRPYSDQEYLAIAADLDTESAALAKRVLAITVRALAELTGDALHSELDSLHERSDRLADLVEGMTVSPKLDPAHKYRVLAYNMLNQSDFEATMYFDTHDQEHKRRADLLRDASHKALTQAQELGQSLGSGATAGGQSAGAPVIPLSAGTPAGGLE